MVLQLGRFFIVLGITSTLIVNPPWAIAETNRSLHPLSSTSVVGGIEQGLRHYHQGRFQDAIQVWKLSLQESKAQGKSLQQAEIWNYVSLAYQKLGQWQLAKRANQRSLDLLAGALGKAPQRAHTKLYARGLNTRGQLEWALGQPRVALKTWTRSAQVYGQVGDATGKMGSLINQAQALEMLGLYHRACQTILLALEQGASCQTLEDSEVDKLLQVAQEQNSNMRRIVLRSLGNILRVRGNLEQAHELLSATQPLQQNPLEASVTYISMGKTAQAQYEQLYALREREEHQRVLSMAHMALAYYQRATEQAATLPESNALRILAPLHQLNLLISMEQRGIDSGEKIKSKIDAIVVGVRNSRLDQFAPGHAVIYAQLNFAQALLEVSPSQTVGLEAMHYTQMALRGAETIQDKRAQSLALGTLGKIYELDQQWTNAQSKTEAALGLSQAIQATDLIAQWQWQMGRIAAAQNRTMMAVSAYQAAISHVTVRRDALQSANPQVQFSFQETVEPMYRQLADLLLREKGKALDEQVALKLAISTLDGFRRAELENILNCDLSTLISLEKRSVDPSAAIIYPIILGDRIDVILKLPNGQPLHHYSTPLEPDEIDQTLNHLRRQLERPVISKAGLHLSQRVYDWLIRPAESQLETQSVDTLVFALDGSLRDVPMAALHDGDQYLIEKGYAVGLISGLQLFDPQSLNKKRLRALSFGLSQSPPHTPNLPPLPNVETELNQLQTELRTKQYLNQTFTHRTLQTALGDSPAQIVHLATHGQFSSLPGQTFVQAWDQPILGQTLSVLLKRRTQETQVPIELLVLSACETAAGDDRATLGLAGLTIQSGARSTLATLWSVDDRSTAQFMGNFYQVLSQQTTSKAEAIRQAQVNLLNTPGYRSPRYWAPFVLVGNWL